MTFELSLQTALYQALTGNSALNTAIGGKIYDHVPQKTEYPFISIGEAITQNFDSQAFSGFSVDFDINVWTREPNLAGLKTFQGLIYDALHGAELSQSGYTFTPSIAISSQNFLDDDGETWRGLQTFQTIVEKSL